MRPRLLILVAVAAFVVSAERFSRASSAQADAGAYVGSTACRRCHENQYASWRRTLHVQMTKPIAEATVVGDFTSGATLQQYGRAYTFNARDGRYFVSLSRNSQPAETFEVNYTLGARRFQGYLSKLADGRIYVLPVFWHNDAKRWVDFKEITPIPDDPSHDLRQIWNVTCVNCHATNLAKNYDVAANTYATTWTEMGIGCEACHGPGRGHVAQMDEWERNPAVKPAYDASPANRALGDALKIFSPRTAAPRQVFDTCGYCHGNKTNLFFGFKPGDHYEDYAMPFLISDPLPANDPQGEFWPDGRPSRFNRPQALTLTGCFQKGEATCTNCHRMHGSNNDHMLKIQVEAPGGGHTAQSDGLCTQCHDTRSASLSAFAEATADRRSLGGGWSGERDWTAHTHHSAESQGSRCIGCHMSDVNWRMFTRRRDHTFQPPVPEMTARFGVPNACTTCHEEKSPEWAAATMNRWYGNADRRAAVVALSESLYRAGTGDPAVLPELARLAVDRSRGILIRASAAEFAAQLLARGSTSSPRAAQEPGSPRAAQEPARPELVDQPSRSALRRSAEASAEAEGRASPAIVNALIGAADDREPIIRAAAVQALSLVAEPRVVPVLAARLADSARVVRVRAAAALLNLGVSTLEGKWSEPLARAQDEWETSLRTFSDVAADHTTLGRLLAARAKPDEAARELRIAIALDPADARPHVQLGILAARAGRLEEAIQRFKAAKSLNAAYPNIDRLIEEAQKRR